MAAWTPNILFPLGSILTSAKMNQLRDNITALSEGSDGAPAIANAALNSHPWSHGDLNSACVRRAKISTATSVRTGTIATDSTVVITLPAYCFFPAIVQTSGTGGPIRIEFDSVNPADPDNPTFRIRNVSSDFQVGYEIKYRYILG